MSAFLEEWLGLGVGVALLGASTGLALLQCGKSRQQPLGAKKASLKSLDGSSKRKSQSLKTAKSVSGKSAKVKSGKKLSRSSSSSSKSSKSKSAKEAAKKKLAAAKEKASQKVVKPAKEAAEKLKKEASKAVKKEEPKKETEAAKIRSVSEIDFPVKKEMILSTHELRFSETGGLMRISMQNPTDERQAIKVKCSDNNIYRVSPVFAFVEPGQTHSIDIIRQNGAVKMDKLVLVQANASAAKTEDPRAFFNSLKNAPVTMHVVSLYVY